MVCMDVVADAVYNPCPGPLNLDLGFCRDRGGRRLYLGQAMLGLGRHGDADRG